MKLFLEQDLAWVLAECRLQMPTKLLRFSPVHQVRLVAQFLFACEVA